MALRRRCSCLLSLLLSAYVSVCVGLRIEQTDSPRVWSVHAGTAPNDQALRSIVSHTYLQVYLLYAASSDTTALATIRVRGDNSIHDYGSSGFSSSLPGELVIASGAVVEGVEITIHLKEQLYHVEAASYGDVVVDHGVVAANDHRANVTFISSSMGNVYLPPQWRVNVATLSLQARGYGNMRLVASDVTVDALDVHVSSDGSVKLYADRLHAQDTIAVRVERYGDTSLSVSTLQASQLNVTTSSGDAVLTVANSASAVLQCNYRLSGVGQIQAGSVKCTNAVVQNTGSCDIILQVSDSLTSSTSSYGEVYYSGPRPKLITSAYGRQDPSVYVAVASNDPPAGPSWADGYTLPPHHPFDVVAPSSQPRVEEVYRDPSGGGMDQNHASHVAVTHQFPWRMMGITVVIIGFLVVRRACRRSRRRGRRDEKSRLVPDDEPVYI